VEGAPERTGDRPTAPHHTRPTHEGEGGEDLAKFKITVGELRKACEKGRLNWREKGASKESLPSPWGGSGRGRREWRGWGLEREGGREGKQECSHVCGVSWVGRGTRHLTDSQTNTPRKHTTHTTRRGVLRVRTSK